MSGRLHAKNGDLQSAGSKWRKRIVGATAGVLLGAAIASFTLRSPAKTAREHAVLAVSGQPLPRQPPRVLSPVPIQSRALAANSLAKDYDPRPLFQLAGLKAVFEGELRDEGWASRMEEVFAPMVSSELKRFVPGVSHVELVCRSTMCGVHWELAEGVPAEANRRIEGILDLLIPSYSRGAGGETQWFLHWHEGREADRVIADMKHQRQLQTKWLTGSEDGRGRLRKLGIEPESWSAWEGKPGDSSSPGGR
jgi:hypothetical protein